MNGAFYIGATGLRSQQSALEVVANNIANLNTPAFKRASVHFSEVLGPEPAGGALAGVAGPTMSGVRLVTESRELANGDLRQTGQRMDLAIDGPGFLELAGPEGARLWRGGSLRINPDGFLAAENRLPLAALISVPRDVQDVQIDPDGAIWAIQDGKPAERIGDLELVLVESAELQALGGGLYSVGEAQAMRLERPGENGAGVIAQGAVEASNVELSQEMVTLLLMQRAFAANAQVVQVGDQLMSIANNLRR